MSISSGAPGAIALAGPAKTLPVLGKTTVLSCGEPGSISSLSAVNFAWKSSTGVSPAGTNPSGTVAKLPFTNQGPEVGPPLSSVDLRIERRDDLLGDAKERIQIETGGRQAVVPRFALRLGVGPAVAFPLLLTVASSLAMGHTGLGL